MKIQSLIFIQKNRNWIGIDKYLSGMLRIVSQCQPGSLALSGTRQDPLARLTSPSHSAKDFSAASIEAHCCDLREVFLLVIGYVKTLLADPQGIHFIRD
jgi:hypothetical protein